MLIVFIDYDSTLNNMMDAWIQWINDEYDKSYTHEDVTHWAWFNELEENAFRFFHSGLAFKLIDPLPHSQEFFAHLTEEFETHILTASTEQMKKPKNAHIEKHYGDVSVIHHREKWDYATHPEKICILIDDRPLNCIEWVKAGGIAFLFNHEGRYNYSVDDFEHENLIKAVNYEEIKEHLKKIKG